MSALTDYWLEIYRKKRGVSYVGFKKRDAVILAQLSKEYGEKTLRTIIKRFLEIEDEPHLRRSGWDTRALATRARGIYVDVCKRYGEAAVEEANERREATKRIAGQGRVLELLDRIGGKP